MGVAIHLHDMTRPSHRRDKNATHSRNQFLLQYPMPIQWQGLMAQGHGSWNLDESEFHLMAGYVLCKNLQLLGFLYRSCQICFRDGPFVCERDVWKQRHPVITEATD